MVSVGGKGVETGTMLLGFSFSEGVISELYVYKSVSW